MGLTSKDEHKPVVWGWRISLLFKPIYYKNIQKLFIVIDRLSDDKNMHC